MGNYPIAIIARGLYKPCTGEEPPISTITTKHEEDVGRDINYMDI